MNVTDYTYLINKPHAINETQTESLGKVLDEFPFFQSARALRLKGLYNQNSFKYNYALKVTAAHTTDRTVLFDFITSDTFVAIQKGLYERKILELLDINVVDYEIIKTEANYIPILSPIEKAVNTMIDAASLTDVEEEKFEKVQQDKKLAEEKLEIGKPLDFSINEKHSFQEWLQLSRTHPIVRENEDNRNLIAETLEIEKQKKLDLINKFIESSPKIPQMKTGVGSTTNFEYTKEDNSYLMTETLARVYLEQKKYLKAIQAYNILILKYPEKSSFFADRISDIKILQQNNK